MNDMSNEANALSSTDADWVAFQYLMGELAEDAALRFETRLQDDQLAREALARAVEVTTAVTLIESRNEIADPGPMPASIGSDSAWLVPAAWLAAAALACVAFVLFWNPGAPLPNLNAGGHSVAGYGGGDSTRDAGELASLWINAAEFLVAADLANDELLFDEVAVEQQGVSPVEEDVDRLRAPSWMVAALSGSSNVEPLE